MIWRTVQEFECVVIDIDGDSVLLETLDATGGNGILAYDTARVALSKFDPVLRTQLRQGLVLTWRVQVNLMWSTRSVFEVWRPAHRTAREQLRMASSACLVALGCLGAALALFVLKAPLPLLVLTITGAFVFGVVCSHGRIAARAEQDAIKRQE